MRLTLISRKKAFVIAPVHHIGYAVIISTLLSLPAAAQTVASVNPADDYFPLREKHYQHPLSNSTWRKAVNSFITPGLSMSEIEKRKSSPEQKKAVVKPPVKQPVVKVQKKNDGLSVTTFSAFDNLSSESLKVVRQPQKNDSQKKSINLVSLPASDKTQMVKTVPDKPESVKKMAETQFGFTIAPKFEKSVPAIAPVPDTVSLSVAPLPPERKAAPLVLAPEEPITEAPKPQTVQENKVVSCGSYSLTQAEVRELVSRIAKEEGIDPKLAEAIAKVESDMGKKQISPAGAVGIMQLMPDTATEMGVKDSCHPEQNIRGGVRYFRKMLDEFGDPLLALGAYNAGSRRVYERRGIPTNSETVGYVVKVLNHWLDYDGHLNGRRQSTTGRSLSGIEDTIPEVNTPEPVNSNNWVEGHLITD